MEDNKRNPRIWIRMGWELAALNALAGRILCDKSYQSVMNKKELNGLWKAIRGIDEVRCAADLKYTRYVHLFGPELFFGHALDPARNMVDDFRLELAAGSIRQGDRLYELSKEVPTNGK